MYHNTHKGLLNIWTNKTDKRETIWLIGYDLDKTIYIEVLKQKKVNSKSKV